MLIGFFAKYTRSIGNFFSVPALQALRDTGKIKAGHKVLINGASEGVGTFAVPIIINVS